MSQKEDDFSKKELLKKLSKAQYEVTQLCSTEPPFSNEYWLNHEPGLYVDVVDGTPLFCSIDKFDSASGWPSFTKPIDLEAVSYKEDVTHGLSRIEVQSTRAQSHLGHVFDDGPGPAHKRFCINSASMRFVHARDLKKEGYEAYSYLFPEFDKAALEAQSPDKKNSVKEPDGDSVAILAGGCFWGVQELVRNIPGVIHTEVGYTGGDWVNPKYSDVKTGKTGHAEAVKILFDPQRVAYEDLLDAFFSLHDPTTLNQQGHDKGTQYRSVIFYVSEEQKKSAEKKIAEWNAAKKWKAPIVTQVVFAKAFYPAEAEHQDYLQKYPSGYTCHYYRKF